MQQIGGNFKAGKSKRPVISRFSPWLRLYTSIRNDPKVLALSHPMRWNYIAILTCAADSPDGILPPIGHLAIELRLTPCDAQQAVNDLIECGLLDIVRRGESATLRPHNWSARQYKSDTSTSRVREYRQRASETACNADETFHGRYSSVSALYSASDSESVDTQTICQKEGDESKTEDTREGARR